MSEHIIETINSIDKQALKMAMIAAQHPALREKQKEVAALLKENLMEAVAELKNVSPDAYKTRSEQITDIFLDLEFAQIEMQNVSYRMYLFLNLQSINAQQTEEKYNKPFPLPDNIQNLTNTLKTDMINFQTTLTLEDIANFYRTAFAQQGLKERKLFAYPDHEYVTLIFEGLLNKRIILVSAVDLAYGMNQDLRNVTIKTEIDTWNS